MAIFKITYIVTFEMKDGTSIEIRGETKREGNIAREVENEFMDSWFDIPEGKLVDIPQDLDIDNISGTDLDIDEVVETK
ncbi:MAG TPA: hypothetical protein EYQ42_08965 [Thiotrichaceae bacterium]|jgi:hypothetical protein|nr:hypothetical protein [Thiotrichaceae bacterium]